MNDCLFCKIASGDIPATIVYQDDRAVAFSDINPQAPVHILIIPRRHLGGPQDAGPEHEGEIGHLFTVARRLAEEQGVAENGFRVVMNAGSDGGQTVFHAHLHLLGGRPFSWPPG